MPKIIGTYEKSQKSQAHKFARSYSKTFPNNRIVVENFEDANGITVWSNSNMFVSNEISVYIKGTKKRK